MENSEQLVEVIQLLNDMKSLNIYGIASQIACFTVALIAFFSKGWKA